MISAGSIYKHIAPLVDNGKPATGVDFESAILNFNGRMIVISFNHTIGSGPGIPPAITVRDYATGALLAPARTPWPNGGPFGTAIIINGTIHLFASKDASTIVHSTLDANFNPSPATTIYTFTDGVSIANLAIAQISHNKFIMSVERPPTHSVSFLQSNDPNLSSWQDTGQKFSPGVYLGSPSLYFNPWNSTYYLPWATSQTFNLFYMVCSKSTDLQTWQLSPTTLLYPDLSNEGVNSTDPRFAQDVNGLTQFIYLDGDQSTWANLRNGFCPMSLFDFLASLF